MDECTELSEAQIKKIEHQVAEQQMKLEQGTRYFQGNVPLVEIADPTERLGWKCANAYRLGTQAPANAKNPFEGGRLSYEKAMLMYHFEVGHQEKNEPRS